MSISEKTAGLTFDQACTEIEYAKDPELIEHILDQYIESITLELIREQESAEAGAPFAVEGYVIEQLLVSGVDLNTVFQVDEFGDAQIAIPTIDPRAVDLGKMLNREVRAQLTNLVLLCTELPREYDIEVALKQNQNDLLGYFDELCDLTVDDRERDGSVGDTLQNLLVCMILLTRNEMLVVEHELV